MPPIPSRVTRAEAIAAEEGYRRQAAVAPDEERAAELRKLADVHAQLIAAMDALGGLTGLQIWQQVEAQMRAAGTGYAALVVVVPRGAAAGAGIGIFRLELVGRHLLRENHVKTLGAIAVDAFAMAVGSLAKRDSANGT